MKIRPDAGTDDYLMAEFYKNEFPPQFVRKMIEFNDHKTTNTTSDAGDICKNNVQYRAEVIFRLATNSISVTVISRRLSFFDKMSSFGKYQ